AAAHRNQLLRTQPAQVVRDEALGLADGPDQFPNLPVTPGELAEQPPTNRMTCELQKLRRERRRQSTHGGHGTSSWLDRSRGFDSLTMRQAVSTSIRSPSLMFSCAAVRRRTLDAFAHVHVTRRHGPLDLRIRPQSLNVRARLSRPRAEVKESSGASCASRRKSIFGCDVRLLSCS
ncbi:MAG: hypothetical protein QOC79_1093, partial [Actinomycetota bacterium]|nr:hypothetical protein [Actinomycetota bacterium]